MQALVVTPNQKDSARLADVPEPPADDGPILVETLAVGVCGTDIEITSGLYGFAPPGQDYLVIGHESLGRVEEAPAGSGLAAGDLVVGIVRRPDPVPCPACAVDQWDMCKNGQYTERGIKERDGYCSERYRIHPKFAVKVDAALGLCGVLLEPASVLAKAWDHIERIGQRAAWDAQRVLITGAGPIGLLGALMGRQRGHDVHVIDRVTDGPKPGLVADLGATYHTGAVADVGRNFDVIIECTGVGQLVLDAMTATNPGGIVCLTGVSSGGHELHIDAGAVNRELVLENDVIFGTVNANRSHYELGADVLAKADRSWLERLITRKVPVDQWSSALSRQPDDVKVVITIND